MKSSVNGEDAFVSKLITLFYLREGNNLKIEGLGMVGRVEMKNGAPEVTLTIPSKGMVNNIISEFLESLPRDVVAHLTPTHETGLDFKLEKSLKDALGVRNGGMPTKNRFSPTYHDVTLQLLFLGLITVVQVREGSGISIHRLEMQVTDKGCELLGFTDVATVRGIVLRGKQ